MAVSVQLRGLTKDFVTPGKGSGRTRAVDGVDLEVGAGELVTLLGPSGCGKTTVLRMIAGFEDPTAGAILIDGQDVTPVPPHRRNAPMVFQSYALFPHLSVRENAGFGLSTRGVARGEARARVDEMARTMGLSDLLDRSPHQLSGGQQQRVALLRALVCQPGLLLFDEPLSNLDAQMRVAMRNEIRRVQRDGGITAIYVTHDQSEAMSLADRMVVMQGGRVAQIGTPAEVYGQPSSEFVARFLGEANFVPAHVVERVGETATVHLKTRGALGEVAVHDVPRLAGADLLTLVVRPEALRLTDDPGGIRATVQSFEYLGAEALVVVSCGDVALRVRIPNPGAAAALAVGREVRLTLESEILHALRPELS